MDNLILDERPIIFAVFVKLLIKMFALLPKAMGIKDRFILVC